MQFQIFHKFEKIMAKALHNLRHRELSTICLGGGSGNKLTARLLQLTCPYTVLLLVGIPLKAQTISTPDNVKDTIFIYNTVKVLIFGDSKANGLAVPLDSAKNSAALPGDSLPPLITEDFDRKPIFALRSNLLVPLLNVGIQIPIGNRFSVGLDWYYPFIRREWSENLDQTNCFEALGPGVDVRYYFGKKHSKGRENWLYRLSGHSVGVFGMFGRYDWEREFWGHQANFVNVGVDYMWSSRIGKKKRMRLDMSIGVGGFFSHGTEYHVFRPKGLAYRTGKKKNITWIGPNKATISLVIPIYTKIRKKAVNE